MKTVIHGIEKAVPNKEKEMLAKLIDGTIEELVIPEGTTEIHSSYYQGLQHSPCLALENLKTVKLPSTLTTIGNSAFANCSSLINITIPESVTSIGSQAFDNCTSLTSIKIPKSVTMLKSRLFANCSKLEEVELPSTITSIDSGAGSWSFYGTKSGITIKCGFSEGAVAGAPWGATNANIIYDYDPAEE